MGLLYARPHHLVPACGSSRPRASRRNRLGSTRRQPVARRSGRRLLRANMSRPNSCAHSALSSRTSLSHSRQYCATRPISRDTRSALYHHLRMVGCRLRRYATYCSRAFDDALGILVDTRVFRGCGVRALASLLRVLGSRHRSRCARDRQYPRAGVGAHGVTLSFYDSASPFIIGVAIIIAWKFHDSLSIHPWLRWCIIIVGVLVVVASLRRSVILGLLAATVLLALDSRGTRTSVRIVVVIALISAVSYPLVSPGENGAEIFRG